MDEVVEMWLLTSAQFFNNKSKGCLGARQLHNLLLTVGHHSDHPHQKKIIVDKTTPVRIIQHTPPTSLQ